MMVLYKMQLQPVRHLAISLVRVQVYFVAYYRCTDVEKLFRFH